MTREEDQKKFDQIVDFSGVEKFIDTPVKRYSSGMYVRLAFAVAAHLEPEILIVDEVLAVGDVEFQKRCLGKMNEVATSGRTVLFVSHNMAAVEALCNNAILLQGGELVAFGATPVIIQRYQNAACDSVRAVSSLLENRGRARNAVPIMRKVILKNADDQPVTSFPMGGSVFIEVEFDAPSHLSPVLGIVVKTDTGASVFGIDNRIVDGFRFDRVKRGMIVCQLDRLPLMPGQLLGRSLFRRSAQQHRPGRECYFVLDSVLRRVWDRKTATAALWSCSFGRRSGHSKSSRVLRRREPLSEATTSRSARIAAPYSTDFFNKTEREGRGSAEVIVPLAMRLFAPRSVVDVGCGTGEWLTAFQRAGVKRVYGLDGQWVDQDKQAIRPDCFQSTDLTGEWSIPGKFDLAVCLEVAEHLPESSSARFVKRLVGAAPAILFSAAIPGQGGQHHVNEQWPEYWEKLFSQYDYVCVDPFRRYIWQDKRVAWYYQQNLYAYIQRTVVESSPVLQCEFQRKRDAHSF